MEVLLRKSNWKESLHRSGYERLHEAFELGGKNDIHQQDRDEKNHHQLVQHLAVGEETDVYKRQII